MPVKKTAKSRKTIKHLYFALFKKKRFTERSSRTKLRVEKKNQSRRMDCDFCCNLVTLTVENSSAIFEFFSMGGRTVRCACWGGGRAEGACANAKFFSDIDDDFCPWCDRWSGLPNLSQRLGVKLKMPDLCLRQHTWGKKCAKQ